MSVTTSKLCSRSGTFPTKNERELTTVYFSQQPHRCGPGRSDDTAEPLRLRPMR